MNNNLIEENDNQNGPGISNFDTNSNWAGPKRRHGKRYHFGKPGIILAIQLYVRIVSVSMGVFCCNSVSNKRVCSVQSRCQWVKKLHSKNNNSMNILSGRVRSK